MIYGFIGTGTITEALIDGLMGSRLNVQKVIVSPRNAAVASRLAERYARVEIATGNQSVADKADVLILAVRPQIVEEVLAAIRIPFGRKLISVVAGISHEKLSRWTSYPESEIVRATPLPFVSYRDGVTAIFPKDETSFEFFSSVGKAVECESQMEFDLLATASAMMGTYYGIMERVSDWLIAKGLDEHKARSYLTPLFSSLAHVAENTSHTGYMQLRHEFSTEGGLNEQIFKEFDENGGTSALTVALDNVLTRIRN
ncbi:pyrroline-5-carboxylate reductase [Ochrobactrum sp. GPK 3]